MSNLTCPRCHQPCTESDLAILPRGARAPEEPSSVRIVKAGQIFMSTKAGQAVLVPNRLLEHRSTLLATHSVEEWEALLAKGRERATAIEGTSSVKLAAEIQKKASAANKRRAEAAAADPGETK